METIEISLIVEDEDIECYGRDDFEVTFERYFERDGVRIILDSLYFKGKDVSHLMHGRFICICEAISDSMWDKQSKKQPNN